MKIYYLFSSITFLQLYIPLVIEGNKRNFNSVFILRNNYKKYANPLLKHNYKILENHINKYNISIVNSNKININEIEGIVFMVDGDIYGPPRNKGLKQSLLFKLNKDKTTKISLIEHMNYKWVYNHYINKVDYCVFPNEAFTDEFNFLSNKNIYLGNTKYDNIPDEEFIYDKYKLDKNRKFCLILFPKPQFREKYDNNDLRNIYKYLNLLDFKIIVKTRPKDIYKGPINDTFKSDYFVCSDIYPNESLELMKISDLCIIFSSSANEETIFSNIPCIDFRVDQRKIERHNFFLDDNVCRRIEKWNGITYDNFRSIINDMESKNSEYFAKIKKQFLFTHKNSAVKYFDFITKNIL